MELKVMTWNIQGAAVLSWNKSYEIKKELVDKIFDQKADVAVLTELVISKGWEYLVYDKQNWEKWDTHFHKKTSGGQEKTRP